MKSSPSTTLFILAALVAALVASACKAPAALTFMFYLSAVTVASILNTRRIALLVILISCLAQMGVLMLDKNVQPDITTFLPPLVFLILASLINTLLSLHLVSLNEGILERDGEVMRLQMHNDSLTKLANTDSLTELPNRRRFFEDANREFARHQRQKVGFALMIIDIDHFKRVNDVFGHLEGDVVLEKISDLLRNESRQLDLLGRLGGEEFAIVSPANSINSALEMANRLCEKCRSLEFDIPINLSISIGLTEVHNDDTDFVDCMRRADKLLFRAKNNGRDRIEFG